MDFSNPQKNQYAYMLENFDEDWVYCSNRRNATYTNLDPGEYMFRVKGSNNDEVWNDQGTSLKIIIRPPWWQTLLAKILFILFIIGVIVIIFYIRDASLRKQKKLLATKVEERTRELQEKNTLLIKQSEDLIKTNILLKENQDIIREQSEELKATAENMENVNKELAHTNLTKDKLFSIIAHDLKNPFNVILGYTDLLITNFDEWADSQKVELLGFIKESSANAYNLLENLLNWSRSQRGTLEYDPVPANASENIELAIQEVISLARKKGVEIVNKFRDRKFQIMADQNMLALICRNLLTNAIKFSNPGGQVFIDVTDKNNGFACFSISDQGIGMEKTKTETLFNPDLNTSTAGTSGEKGTGLGLILCKEFIAKHNGEIWVESKLDKGTTFYFTIPKLSDSTAN